MTAGDREWTAELRKKVAALFPAHEVELFTELFWRRIGAWREDNRPGAAGAPR